MTIENVGDMDYQLVGIETDFDEMTMIHETTVDDAGVARMKMVGRLDIPAGETVQLAPVGYHGMLTDLTRDLYPDEAVKLMLTFADSSGATFEVPVGAVVTDFPPEESTIRVLNVAAVQADDGALELSLSIDNDSPEQELLISVTTAFEGTEWVRNEPEGFAPSIILLPNQEVRLTSDEAFIRVTDTGETPPDAFPIILIFASGKIVTVGVPIVTGASQ
jgi:copper(I)-binding protein